jgi:hypothetical protein
MRSFKIALLAAGMLCVSSLQAQTVDEIINKYFEALGGKDKVASINTVYMECDMDMNANAGKGFTWVVNNKAMKNEMDFMGQHIIQCYTDTSGWTLNPFMGQTTPTIMKPDEVKAGKGPMDLAGPFFNYAAKCNTIELLGKETIDGKAAYKLKIKNKDGIEVTSWIDATTSYVLKNQSKTTVQGTEFTSSMSMSNYKKMENGYVMPFNAELTMSTGLTIYFNYKKIEINKEIDMTIFPMPKQ